MEKMLVIEGEMIHRVGYRPFLLAEALKRKKITNFEAENIKEKGKQKVIINMVGEETKILEFASFVKNNFPDYAKNCKIVMEDDKCPEEVMHINDFRDILNVEQVNNIVQGALQLKDDTNQNFDKMDKKYDRISQKMESIDSRMESIDNSIKDLTKVIRTFAEALINDIHNKK